MKASSKNPSESEVVMRELVLPSHTNSHGTIFGGTLMGWIDIAAAMCAMKHAENPVVTAHIDSLDFITPIKLGSHVIIKASINYAGNSSMVIGVRVECENPFNGEIRKTTKAYLTFVALDEFSKPVSVPKVEPKTDDDKRRYENAKTRIEERKNIRNQTKK
jgi:acyl-CoA hydrolase